MRAGRGPLEFGAPSKAGVQPAALDSLALPGVDAITDLLT